MSARLFLTLTSVLSRHEGPVILGGDFNCTLNTQLDRFYVVPGRRHDYSALRWLLAHTGLVDVLSEEVNREEEERNCLEFHVNAHTHFYRLPNGRQASFGLLYRWYIIT